MFNFTKVPPEVGMIICTRMGQKHTNGIIIEINKTTNGKEFYTVLTDWGNVIHKTLAQLDMEFQPSANWFEAKSIGYPLPSVTERIQEQIEKLQETLEELTNEG